MSWLKPACAYSSPIPGFWLFLLNCSHMLLEIKWLQCCWISLNHKICLLARHSLWEVHACRLRMTLVNVQCS